MPKAKTKTTRAKTIKRSKPNEPKSTIPDFNNLDEERDYWNTHSLADHWDEFKPVDVTFAANLTEGITVRFDPATLQQLRTKAKSKGLGATSLIRMWVMERLANEGITTV